MRVLGYDIAWEYPEFDFTGTTIINTINPHSYCVARKDASFQRALKASDILLPDGTGMVWAARILNGKNISRITGSDIHRFLLRKARQKKLSIFYMGASPKTLSKMKDLLGHEYPAVACATYSPPYKAVFSEEDNQKMQSEINAFNPDILFVGMTAPKQEKWVYQNKKYLNAKVICSIGAVFDFYAGTVKRPGPVWQKLGLEWLPRLTREPKRLWRRNFISIPGFLMDVAKSKFGNL